MKDSSKTKSQVTAAVAEAPKRLGGAIITSKLSRPVAPDGGVQRDRLLERLDDALEKRVVLISAPAGFGKSVLAVQWLDRAELPCAWVSLDTHDGEPEPFVRYLVAAIEGTTGVVLEESAALLAAREAPPFEYLAEVVVRELTALEGPLVVALDDFHNMRSSEVHELLERIVTLAPPSLVVMVITRRDPPWPIGHWNAQEWLVELRERDLRFSLEETRRFFAPNGASLSDDTVALLHERAEGWIAGLRLLKLSLRGAEQPEERARHFSGRDRLVADYLATEVLARQPPEVRQFLVATVLLPRFCASLADHLLSEGAAPPAAGETLAQMEHENLFLVRLDREGSWYRYHHLFRDLLLHHLPEVATGEARAALLRRAASWFAGEALCEEALQLYIEAGDLDAAADLVAERLRAVTEEDPSRRQLARWLDMFPEGAERGRLALLVARGFVKITHWDLPGLVAVTDEADRLLRERPSARSESGVRHDLAVDLAAEMAYRRYWSGDATGALEAARTALADLPVATIGGSRTLALLYQAGALRMLGRLQEAVRSLQEAVTAELRADRPRVAELLFAEGVMYLYEGDMNSAALLARRAKAAHEVARLDDFWLGHVLYLAAAVAYERNQLEEAEAGFHRVRELRFRTGTRPFHDALIGLSLIARARGDEEAAARHAADGRAFALQVHDPTSLRVADSFDAHIYREVGRSMAAGPPPPPDHTSFFIEVPTLTYAECLLRDPSRETRAAALLFIEKALERVAAAHNRRHAIAFSMLQALALADRGDQGASLDVLAAAVQRAEGCGLVRTVVDRGARLAELLESLARREGRSEILETLLTAFHKEGSRPSDQGSTDRVKPWQGLTNREVDVLELLSVRLTNKEIGERLFISPETVKRHTLAIYRKLEVKGRRSAVAKAVDNGIIAPPQAPPGR